MSVADRLAELTENEREILDALRGNGPLDAIGISSRTRIPVPKVLELMGALEEKGVVQKTEPEPVHQRVVAAA